MNMVTNHNTYINNSIQRYIYTHTYIFTHTHILYIYITHIRLINYLFIYLFTYYTKQQSMQNGQQQLKGTYSTKKQTNMK